MEPRAVAWQRRALLYSNLYKVNIPTQIIDIMYTIRTSQVSHRIYQIKVNHGHGK